MTALALEIGSREFVAGRVEDGVGDDDVRRAPIPRKDPWDACHEVLRDAAGGAPITALGIAAAGPIDMSAGVIAPTGIRAWRGGFDIVEAARRAYPGVPVRLAIDGVCLALGERNFGSIGMVQDALAISVSQRVVGGIVVGGFVAVGRTGNAGQIGHVLVPGFDELCSCGGRGCLEAVAGGAAALAWARENGWGGTSLEDLAMSAEMGDGTAAAAMERAGTALGRAVASVAALLDIDRVVVGGAMAQGGSALWKPMGEAVAAHARVSYLPGLKVVPSKLGEFGILAGAGVLAATAQE